MKAQLSLPDFADARLPRPGDVVAGKYRIDGFIARGGMGAVLAATHEITGGRIALKWMLPGAEQDAEATHRIVREARASARVRHPNVVDVHDVVEHEGSLFLVMELLEGQTLHARLEAEGALDPETTLALLLPVLHAVEAAHASHVIHRDLKPSNIFLCRGAGASQVTPRVFDFGISKISSGASAGDRWRTLTGAVLGTPHYMPTEQLTGHDVDETADIYALGVILYQCLTGWLPFEDSNYNALVLQIATATPPPVAQVAPHVPRGLSAVVMRAMAREPKDRFASIAELTAALRTAVSEPSVHAEPLRAPVRSWRPWAIALAAACVLAAIAAWASEERAAQTVSAQAEPQALSAPVARAPLPEVHEPLSAMSRDVSLVEIGPPPERPIAIAREPASRPARESARSRRRSAPQQTQGKPMAAGEMPDSELTGTEPVTVTAGQF